MMLRPALAAVLLALVATTTACIGMPENGPVVPADNAIQNPPEAGVERVAQLPQEGDSPQNIVSEVPPGDDGVPREPPGRPAVPDASG